MKEGIKKSFQLGNGQTVTLETGKLATQADGSVVVKVGTTMLLATVVSSKEGREDADFMPLSVDYQEKYASTGRFPGGFFKREARPSENEILTSRLVDRALRPLFPDDYHAETQVLISLISGDSNTLPDAYAALAASSALAVSDIPFHGPISEVRVARIDGELIVNPPLDDLERADIDLMVAATEENIMMVEGESKEISETDMLEAMRFAHDEIKIHCIAQKELATMVEGATEKRTYCHENQDEALEKQVWDAVYDKCYAIACKGTAKKERSDLFDEAKAAYIATLPKEEAAEKSVLINRYFHAAQKDAMRRMILDDRKRLDGRALDEIRPIWTEVGYLPSPHGSAIFTRGETQSLTTVTLGSKLDEQTVDGAVLEGKNKILLHYNFPPFSVGEARMMRGTSRREIGHGNLALRALKNMIPKEPINPYTIRIVSDILESNGSSSMATVCAGTLALMDAGVQLIKPVSGIAMGLITEKKGEKFAVLSDILGDEDHLGDMDFKVTGTRDGITACQMDIKVDGLSYEVLSQALEQARQGRMHILDKMSETLTEPRTDYKEHVPRIEQMIIPSEFIGAVIGPGGKIIQEMQKESGATITIEEVGNTGVIAIMSPDKESIEMVKNKIKGITAIPEVDTIYKGTVKSLQSFGAFVEILPGKDGLLHISEVKWERVEDIEDVLKVGDEIDVKLIEMDKAGKLRLSHRILTPKPEGYVERPSRPPRSNNRQGGDRDNKRRDNRSRDSRDNRDNRDRGPRRNG